MRWLYPSATRGFFALRYRQQLRWPFQNRKRKMINDKQDCIESIIRALEGTAAWRRTTSARLPDDPRNMRAATTLDKLAVDVASITDEQWFELRPHFGGWASEGWRNGSSQTARQVGFHHRANDITSLLKVLVHNLSSVAA
jgi:hypothetical protein